jgi:hypothetical protein
MGVRARCIKGLGKINPFTPLHDWVGILNHVAMTMYVPSYMSWNDEFQVLHCPIISAAAPRKIWKLFVMLTIQHCTCVIVYLSIYVCDCERVEASCAWV